MFYSLIFPDYQLCIQCIHPILLKYSYIVSTTHTKLYTFNNQPAMDSFRIIAFLDITFILIRLFFNLELYNFYYYFKAAKNQLDCQLIRLKSGLHSFFRKDILFEYLYYFRTNG